MPITLATNAMGTRFELVLAGAAPEKLRPAGEAALHEIEECHHRFNLFDPGSWLNSINRRATGEAIALDDETFDLLTMCQQVHEASEGAFDVTVAPLMQAWGFHGNIHGDEQAILAAQKMVGMQHVHLDASAKTVRFTHPGITLDLGGIAKGFAIDIAIQVLRDCGVQCALLHGGTSTVAAIAAPPDEDGWRVTLRTSADNSSNQPAPVVCLKDNAMSISAPHGRTIQSDGKTLGHVLDPRTHRPAACGPFAAVIADSACLTDAWSTALLVLGEAPQTIPDTIHTILPETIADTTSNHSTPTRLEAICR